MTDNQRAQDKLMGLSSASDAREQRNSIDFRNLDR